MHTRTCQGVYVPECTAVRHAHSVLLKLWDWGTVGGVISVVYSQKSRPQSLQTEPKDTLLAAGKISHWMLGSTSDLVPFIIAFPLPMVWSGRHTVTYSWQAGRLAVRGKRELLPGSVVVHL